MKKLGLILFILFLHTSCGSAKKTTQNSNKEAIPIKQEVEIPKPDPSPPPRAEGKKDSLEKLGQFNQVLKKRYFTTHQLWDQLLKKYVSVDGKVDYKGFKSDHKELISYIKVLNVALPNDTHSRKYKIAYWINAYNAMTVDLIVRNYPVKSIKDIDKPWEQRLWKLGEKWYNLDEIEHQILRKMNEPRMHFGIVCASYSCPKLINEAFTGSQLEDQLTQVTRDFLSDTERNNISTDNLKLSKIFKWFAKDFKTQGSLIDFLNKYSDISIANNAKKSFKDYNWNLNE